MLFTVDFSSYQTFQWTNPPEDVQAGGAGAGWVMRSLRRSVVEDLKSRGYQEVDADPDFLVTGYVQFDQPTAGLGAGSRAGMAGQGGAAAYALREGDLHVLILDPSSKEVWSGHASGALGSGDGEPQENLEAVVGRVMERFPPE
jgi:hypothetical protein